MGIVITPEHVSRAKQALNRGEITEDELREYVLNGTPHLWVESKLRDVEDHDEYIKLRPYQIEILSSPAKTIAVRFGRQSGKTVALAARIVWELFTQSNLTVGVYCPRKKHIADIMRYVDQMISESEDLEQYILKKSANQGVRIAADSLPRIEVANGSQAIFYHTQGKTARELIRGSRVDRIFIEEAHYVEEESLVALSGVITSAKDPIVWAQSTPRSKEGWFYEFCNAAELESHHPSTESPDWTDEKERMAKMVAPDAGSYKREYLAEWVDDGWTAFTESAIDSAVAKTKFPKGEIEYRGENYLSTEQVRNMEGEVYIGIDWNVAANGNKIVIMKRPLIEPNALYYQEVKSIESPDYNHITAVDALFDVVDEHDTAGIAVDRGYAGGALQIISEKLGQERHSHLRDKFHIVDFAEVLHIPKSEFTISSTQEIVEDLSDEEEYIKRTMKAFMVSVATQMMLRGEWALSVHDSEIEHKTLVDELRSVKIEKISSAGYPVYSKKDLHKFAAGLLSVYAFFIETGEYEIAQTGGKRCIRRKRPDAHEPIGSFWEIEALQRSAMTIAPSGSSKTEDSRNTMSEVEQTREPGANKRRISSIINMDGPAERSLGWGSVLDRRSPRGGRMGGSPRSRRI